MSAVLAIARFVRAFFAAATAWLARPFLGFIAKLNRAHHAKRKRS